MAGVSAGAKPVSDKLIFAAILAAIAGLGYWASLRDMDLKVDVGSPAHEASLRQMALRCVAEQSELTFEACLEIVREVDRIHPEARPYQADVDR